MSNNFQKYNNNSKRREIDKKNDDSENINQGHNHNINQSVAIKQPQRMDRQILYKFLVFIKFLNKNEIKT